MFERYDLSFEKCYIQYLSSLQFQPNHLAEKCELIDQFGYVLKSIYVASTTWTWITFIWKWGSV